MATNTAKIRNYTETEWNALDEKMLHPENEVMCPRCGDKIDYDVIGNSISVKCRTPGCIFGGLRGL